MLHVGVVRAGKAGVDELFQLVAPRLPRVFQCHVGKAIAVAADSQWKQAGAVCLGHGCPPSSQALGAVSGGNLKPI
ncbi:hypothetical protein D3C85_1481430 [compost metagenome]